MVIGKYSVATGRMHWLMAAGTLTTIGTVKMAQLIDCQISKEKLMLVHKSTGLLMAGAIFPRIAIRLASKTPNAPKGTLIEHVAARISHLSLYGFMLFMPATGIAMGYYGGKGLPFYGLYKLPGKEVPDGNIAKNAFQLHKNAGRIFQYILPIHIGATGFHLLKGQNIINRLPIR